MRTEPLEGGPEISASGGLFGFRKRMDGGYTVATLGVRTIDLVPDNFRLLLRTICRQCGCTGRSCASASAAALSRNGARRGVGASTRHRRSRRCACSTPKPTRSSLDARAPASAESFPGLPQRRGRRELGRHDRRDARCDPGHLGGRQPARLLHRHRVFRPRLRHRPRRRQAGRRHGRRRPDRSSTRRRSACRGLPTARTRGRTRSRADWKKLRPARRRSRGYWRRRTFPVPPSRRRKPHRAAIPAAPCRRRGAC